MVLSWLVEIQLPVSTDFHHHTSGLEVVASAPCDIIVGHQLVTMAAGSLWSVISICPLGHARGRVALTGNHAGNTKYAKQSQLLVPLWDKKVKSFQVLVILANIFKCLFP